MGYISPTLAVRDMKATLEFYTKALGFKAGMTFPTLDDPEYADISKDGMVLMFLPTKNAGIEDGEALGRGVNLYLQIDGDIDAYYGELKKRGVKIIADIKDEPYGIRDFTVADPDGYLLTFNQVPQPGGKSAAGFGAEEELCENCEIYVTTNCQSCGMPMTSPAEHGGGYKENLYCVNCCDTSGSLRSFEEVLESMTGFMMESRKMERKEAEIAARQYLAMMPAWSGR
ncbi:MAG: VOC family protein [Dehalococcoidales bacterium]|nr:VOC family protein [Dehalococcoidales bacterium]